MNKRPIPVIVIGCLYVATGAIGLASHLIAFKPQHPFQYDIVWISLVSLIAIVCGIYMLRGSNWARWLGLAWMAFHVILSVFHSRSELVVHSLLFVAFAYFLFRPPATQYFRAAGTSQ
jgi:CHASE2 domain-containing sensor protein